MSLPRAASTIRPKATNDPVDIGDMWKVRRHGNRILAGDRNADRQKRTKTHEALQGDPLFVVTEEDLGLASFATPFVGEAQGRSGTRQYSVSHPLDGMDANCFIDPNPRCDRLHPVTADDPFMSG